MKVFWLAACAVTFPFGAAAALAEPLTFDAALSRAAAAPVRRQNIRHNSRRKLAECGPRLGLGFMRRACGVASADARWSVA